MGKHRGAQIPIWNRCLLNIDEASSYYHIGSAKLRDIVESHQNADFYIMNGNRVLIKRKQFEEFLEQATVI